MSRGNHRIPYSDADMAALDVLARCQVEMHKALQELAHQIAAVYGITLDKPQTSQPRSQGRHRYTRIERPERGVVVADVLNERQKDEPLRSLGSHRARRLITIRCRRILAATVCAVAFGHSGAVAMTFRIIKTPETNAIVGEGPIEDGDAGRLEKIIPLAGRDSYGNIPLYLNSPGGLVDAAFAIVAVMDKEEFSAFVSSGARCASACASIVYISARFHQVVGTGLLGIHTCYRVWPTGLTAARLFLQ